MANTSGIQDVLTTVISRTPNKEMGEQTLFDGTNHTYRLRPNLIEVDIQSRIVYINGTELDEEGYTIDYYKNLITIHRNITELIYDITIRFRYELTRYNLYREMLILPVSDLIPVQDLHHYTPAFYDVIGIQRIIQYPFNEWSKNQLKKAGWGHVMEYRVTDEGIIATLKVYD